MQAVVRSFILVLILGNFIIVHVQFATNKQNFISSIAIYIFISTFVEVRDEKLVGGLFAPTPPPILNRVKLN